MNTDKGKYWDEPWNTVIGCTKCSPGCRECYAESLHNMRYEARLAGKKIPKQYNLPFDVIQLLDDRLDKPLHWRNPRTIFVNNMGDTFHKEVPFGFIEKIRGIAAKCISKGLKHRFLFLTKRPDVAYEFTRWMAGGDDISIAEWPQNCWLGTTICNQAEADKNAPIHMQIPGNKWWSLEPLLGPVDFLSIPTPQPFNIDHIVIGCESGPNRRPCKLEWVISLVEQCKAAGVKVFVKQVSINGRVSKKMSEWPESVRVRETI